MIREVFECIKLWYKEMHFSILKLVYMYNESPHVLANHVAIFRDVKYKV
jgi:hypothetical protein